MTRLFFLVAARLPLAGAALACAGAASAQVYAPPPAGYPPAGYPAPEYGTDEDIVVYGRPGRAPDNAEALSQRVSYADLDLYYPEDRRELRRRVSVAARYLCTRLGETDESGSILPSCRDSATRDALRRVGTIEAQWVPRGSYLVR